MSNPNTRVSVHCYTGDEHQVRQAMQLYMHHGCPMTILSPTDSRVTIEGLDCRYAGQREGSVEKRTVDGAIRVVTAGPVANARQLAQMKLLLTTYSEGFFLMNDADSFCLSPEIPRYVYKKPDTVWCNYVNDPLPANQPGYAGYASNFPRRAMQPPYFLPRVLMERMVAVADQVVPNTIMPWIDHYMLQLAYVAGVRVQHFRDSVASDVDRYPENLAPTLALIRNRGCVFIHSSKSPRTWKPMRAAYKEYSIRHGGRA